MAGNELRFVDASVLLTAIRKPTGETFARRMRAHQILNDRNFELVASDFLKLEILPIATFFSKKRELRFFTDFFNSVKLWAPTDILISPALDLASKFGLGALDSLHLCAARYFDAEFVSAEKPTKPIYRAYPKTVSIYGDTK